jgi:hypothetical protein
LDRHPESKEFRDKIRCYNSAFAFISIGVKVDPTVTRASGPYCFKISGKLHHLTGSLLPVQEGANPKYAQIYIHNPDEQLQI